MIPNTRLDELAAMEQAAYKGPWWRTDPPWGDGSAVHAGPSDDPHTAEIFVCTFDHFDQQFMRTFDGIDVDDIPDACKSLANLEFIAAARNEFAAMIEQCREANRDRQDAERYRWLHNQQDRLKPHAPLGVVVWKKNGDRNADSWVDVASGDDLDSLIDAALKGTTE